MTVTAPFPGDMIRPWYPAGHVGHIDADCEELLRWEPEPREGSGWLDPQNADPYHPVCADCLHRHNDDEDDE